MKVSEYEATAVWQQLEKDPIYTLQKIWVWLQTKCIAEAPTVWGYATAPKHEQSSLVVICTSLQLLIRDVTNLLHSSGKFKEKQVPLTSWTCRKTLGEQKRKGREVGVSNCSHWRDDNSSDIIQNQRHISATSSTNNQLPCFIKCRLLLLVSAVDSGWSPHREFHSCPWAPDLHLDYMDTDFSGFFLTWLCMPFWMKEEGRVCIRNYCSAISNLLIPSTPKEESILQESSEEKDHTHPS